MGEEEGVGRANDSETLEGQSLFNCEFVGVQSSSSTESFYTCMCNIINPLLGSECRTFRQTFQLTVTICKIDSCPLKKCAVEELRLDGKFIYLLSLTHHWEESA